MDLQDLTTKVRDIAKQAAVFINEEVEHFDPTSIEYKDQNNSIVSYVDTETEKQLVFGLKQLLPEAGFVAEEGTGSDRTGDYMWYIDPLDGTTNFTHSLPIFSISIGLAYKGEMQLGVVYDVRGKHCYYAWKGGGSFCDGRQIKVSDQSELSKSLLATGFPYHEEPELDKFFEVMKEFMRRTHGLRRLGSAALDLCFVASGVFDGFFEFNLKPWDVAAGALIVSEAGGSISDFGGTDNYLEGNEIVAAGPIHSDMVGVIKGIW